MASRDHRRQPDHPGESRARRALLVRSVAEGAGADGGSSSAEDRLRAALALQEATLQAVAEGVLAVDRNGRWLSWNRRFLDMWSIPAELAARGDDAEVVAAVASQLVDPDGFVETVRRGYENPEAEIGGTVEFHDGRVFERWSVPQRVGDEIVGRVWSFWDVTERARAERARRAIIDSSLDAIVTVDGEGRVIEFNSAAVQVFGYERDEAIGRRLADLIVPESLRERHEDGMRRLRDGGHGSVLGRRVEVLARRSDGRELPMELTVTASSEDPPLFTGFFRDLSAHRAAEAALVRSNELFDRSFEHAPIGMAIGARATGRLVRVNPALCRMVGRSERELLAARSFLEFVAPVDRERIDRAAQELARSERDAYEAEVRVAPVDGAETWLSLHITRVPAFDGSTDAFFAQVLDITDQKRRERELRDELDRLAWLGRVQDALAEGRLVLHAQPIVDLESGRVVREELLVRMADRDGTLVPPGRFLPIAERYGLVTDIDRWVIRQAAGLAAAGRDVSVNLSAQSIGQAELAAYVESELQAAGAEPARVVFELTETALLERRAAAETFTHRMARLGCGFALDDFGTGYGSFTHLKTLPVDYLKIDLEFVRTLLADEANEHVVRAIVNLARGFGQRTIAEGVEDLATLDRLRELGVDRAQGFETGRPEPV